MDCGIYILYWSIDRPYIGQTTQFHVRKLRHINEIRLGIHCNKKILQEYNRTGTLPEIEMLVQCLPEELNTLEEQYIQEFNSIDNGLNIISGGYSVGYGTNNSCSKYTKQQLVEVFSLLADPNNSYKYISKLTGVAETTVKKIGQGAQHTWLHSEHPEIYSKILEITSKDRYCISASAKAQGKSYRRIKAPDGTVYTVSNTAEFAREHNLPNGNLCSVLLGNRKSVKGWIGVD